MSGWDLAAGKQDFGASQKRTSAVSNEDIIRAFDNLTSEDKSELAKRLSGCQAKGLTNGFIGGLAAAASAYYIPRKIFNPPFVVRTPYLIVLGGFTGVVAYFYGMVSCSQPIVRGFLIEKSAETQHPQQPIQEGDGRQGSQNTYENLRRINRSEHRSGRPMNQGQERIERPVQPQQDQGFQGQLPTEYQSPGYSHNSAQSSDRSTRKTSYGDEDFS